MWNDFIYGLGDAIASTFVILKTIGPLMNALCIIGGFAGIAIWLKMQADYNREAEQKGTLK
ncbi:MAG: hypothetical protein KatS3mg034_0451 [Vicingaceae bacterium]|jgi:hypothetical protein|nr:MAG: hypothetical protein KatS3mg034_0451 [Vicingaceae bacterium]